MGESVGPDISVDVQDLFVKNDRLEGTGLEMNFVFYGSTYLTIRVRKRPLICRL